MQTATTQHKHTEPAQTLDSPPNFARYIGVSAQAVRNWCKQGKIPLVVNTGKIVRFERSAAIQALGGKVDA